MMERIEPGRRTGQVHAPSSKSQAHRLLIAAALSQEEVCIRCDDLSADITATIKCLGALGADISREGDVLRVGTVLPGQDMCALCCGESGSTLRFLLPLCGALGVQGVFKREGRLPERPLEPLDGQLRAHGMVIESDGSDLRVSGKLTPGSYTLPGNVSSQYVTGLLMALPLLGEDSTLTIEGRLESADYVAMTLDTLKKSGVRIAEMADGYRIFGVQHYNVPAGAQVEGDYSSAAFFLCMGALSERGVTVNDLDAHSKQGDRRIADILAAFGAQVEYGAQSITVRRGALHGVTVDAAMIPDLVPTLAAVAALSEGKTRFIHAERLRLKESDRIMATAQLLNDLGADVRETQDGLIVRGRAMLSGGTVDPCGDHRLAMTAAVAACGCQRAVCVQDAGCVRKSYPKFWDDLRSLEVE